MTNSGSWAVRAGLPRGDRYDDPFRELERSGADVHGEASFVDSLGPGAVLDAGCGTGRVAIELARRGREVVGVDLDPAMLDAAHRKAPHVEWRLGDLATVDLGRSFEIAVLAGNVMIFLDPGSEGIVVANLARHLAPDGLLVAGFQLLPGRLDVAIFDELAQGAGLELAERWAAWDRQPFASSGGYTVSVHRLTA